MPINIFIDTSILLSFYAVSNDDLEQLEKIIGLINDNQVKIFVPAQVKREWSRNRENKLAEAIKNIEKISFKSPSIPRFMNEYEEIADLRRALGLAEKFRIDAIAKAKIEAASADTNADKLIQRIFSAAGVEEDNPDIFARAKRRLSVGDPPGKPDSLGDRINWEHLLASRLTDYEMHIISKDGDFFSPLDEKVPRYALSSEWFEKKSGKLFVHRELKPFLTSKFPQFQFKRELSRAIPSQKVSNGNSHIMSATDHLLLRKHEVVEKLWYVSNIEELIVLIHDIGTIQSSLIESDFLRIIKLAIQSDVVHEHAGEEEISAFFEGLIPTTYHLLSKKEIQALEVIFGIEIYPEDFESDVDQLIPDYGQMDFDLLAQELDLKSS